MAVDHIRYDLLAQDALRGVVRTVLADAAKNGLPGEHHFYVSFDTRAEGVRLSPRMLAQYPQEMTVVLQHQFWDLVVTDEGFEVGLSFGGIPERLTVPAEGSEAGREDGEERPPARKGRGKARAPAEHKGAPPALTVPAPANPEPAPTTESKKSDKPAGGGEVVRLDRFRKK